MSSGLCLEDEQVTAGMTPGARGIREFLGNLCLGPGQCPCKRQTAIEYEWRMGEQGVCG